jgi:hypothetical protein
MTAICSAGAISSQCSCTAVACAAMHSCTICSAALNHIEAGVFCVWYKLERTGEAVSEPIECVQIKGGPPETDMGISNEWGRRILF